MRLVTYQRAGQAQAGAQLNEHIIDLKLAHRAALQHAGNTDELAVADLRVPDTIVGLLAGGEASLKAARQAISFVENQLPENSEKLKQQGIVTPLDSVTLLSPIQRPSKLICLGLNYRDHAAEAGMAVPSYPVLFHKVAGSLTGHNWPIIIPRISNQIDYEAELAIVIGTRGKYIPEADAYNYIAGYTIANDVSARDLQFRTTQWTTGKMLDTFCPLGPALVTRDEVPDPHKLNLRTILNGQTLQDGNTADMIFSIPFTVSYISTILTLEPGDIILTGTPAGIGNTRNPQIFMKPGDNVTIAIEGLGELTNPVVAE